MGNVQQIPDNTVAQQLLTLAQLYRHGQASDLMNRSLDKILAYEADSCHVQLNSLQEDLTVFERKYSLSSTEFYRRFRAGQTDDRMDYVEWASLVQMCENLQKRLHLLTGRIQEEDDTSL